MNKKLICEILKQEMELATGCTEPAAIAYNAATAREQLPGEVASIQVYASVNMIKNAMAAGLPGTTHTGINYAAALGAIGGKTEKVLQVIDNMDPALVKKAEQLVADGKVTVAKADVPEKLYIKVILTDDKGHTASAVTVDSHTNITQVEQDGKVLVSRESHLTQAPRIAEQTITETLSIQTIYDFVNEMDPAVDDVKVVEDAIRVNNAISQRGQKTRYGLGVGPALIDAVKAGVMSENMTTSAMIAVASGVDARMAGTDSPVMTNSGSGNQGITATMSVYGAGKYLKASDDKILRAVTLSNLMSIHIHSRFGRLSALCGCSLAGTGAACGIVYLLGGGVKELGYAVNNMLGDISGMICDGAKADCALKMSSCINAACKNAFLASRGIGVKSTDGIVEKDPEKTILNFTELGNKGSGVMDNLILDMMIHKQ
jgi:L-cysteine desulfidase